MVWAEDVRHATDPIPDALLRWAVMDAPGPSPDEPLERLAQSIWRGRGRGSGRGSTYYDSRRATAMRLVLAMWMF